LEVARVYGFFPEFFAFVMLWYVVDFGVVLLTA
jgi:hypothetical protein